MSKSPPTRASLLIRLRAKHDDEAWSQFVKIYAPLIHGYGLHNGLQDADAADLVQEVLQRVAAQAGVFEYDPGRGSFRGWLFTVTRNKMRTMIARKQTRESSRGGSDIHRMLLELPDAAANEEIWNRQHELQLFLWSAEQVRGEFQESTWRAFWSTAVENVAAAEVARQLDVSIGAVYIAKSRVLARLRTVIEEIEGE